MAVRTRRLEHGCADARKSRKVQAVRTSPLWRREPGLVSYGRGDAALRCSVRG